MSFFIKLGKWNKNYKYFLLAISFSLAEDIAFGSPNVQIFERLKILNSSDNFFIHKIFCYLFTFILSIIFYLIEIKSSNNQNTENSSKQLISIADLEDNNELELIHNIKEIKEYPKKYIIIIIILMISEEEFLIIYGDIMMHLDFWMVELILITYWMYKILKIKLYKHQIIMLVFCFIPFILKAVTTFLSFYDTGNKYENNDDKEPFKYSVDVNKLKLLYVAYWWLVIPGFIFYLFFIGLRSYINTQIKYLVDLKSISVNKLLIYYGAIGTIFCFIISLISTFVNCGTDYGKYSIQDYFCKVKYNGYRYIENFAAYFSGSGDYIIWQEVLSVILGVIFFFFYKYYCFRTIEHLTPVHIIFSFPIYYMLNKFYLLLINYIYTGSPYIKQMKKAVCILCLDFCSDFISFFGYIIYLEIIELHFCGYDFYIRRHILERCILDGEAKLTKSYKSNSEYSLDKRNESYSSGQRSLNSNDNDNGNEIEEENEKEN